MTHLAHDADSSAPPTVTRLRARCRSLRDQLARSLDARERAIALSERQAEQLETALRTNGELRGELNAAYVLLSQVRDELATERAERVAAREKCS